MTGSSTSHSDVLKMTRHISNENGGLSIAIGTASSALKDKLNITWRQLKSKSKDVVSSSSCFPLHWYRSKFLPSEAELFLLVCSMFPDDFRIPIEDLVIYGMGLKLYEDVHDIFSARCRVHDLISLVNDLNYPRKVIGEKIRLVIEKDGHHNQYVKMVGGTCDLAKLIASNYPLVFRRETLIDRWGESYKYKDCYGLSLVLKKIKVHPTDLKCPKLALLQLQYKEDSEAIPVDFFEGMDELRVLSLDIVSLPQSLNLLKNLKTLRLKVQEIGDISWIGSLTKLEFLSISTSCLTGFPMEMGRLENLKLLDLKEMNIAYISPGVLSRMLKLEELYFPLRFKRWECKAEEHDYYDEWISREGDNCNGESINTRIKEIDEGERINASLSEIASLSLSAIQISIPKALIFPKKSQVFKSIRVFKILVLDNIKFQPFGEDSINDLQLTGDALHIKESGICDLMSRTEKLTLTRVRNLRTVMYQLEDYDFPQLKKLLISECDELEYVIDTTTNKFLLGDDYSFCGLVSGLHLSMLPNLKEIWHGRSAISCWFENLSHISISFCHKLKFGFPLSIVRGWKQLKSMELLDCNEMVGVLYEDEENITPLVLASIEKLNLHSLPKLIGFLVNKGNTINEVHVDTSQSSINNKIGSNCMGGSISTYDSNFELFPTNENSARLNKRWIKDEVLIRPPSISGSRENLQKHVTQQLGSLEQLSPVKNKDVNFRVEMNSAFPSKLAEIWLQNLKGLKIAFCDAIKVVFLFEENHATSRAFNSLEKLELYGLRNLVHIWFQIPPKIIAFQNLRVLVLLECNNLYPFSPRVAKLLVKLQKLCISRCKKMKEIIVKEDEKEVNDKIVFHQLNHLELQYMPNLRMFSRGIHEIEFPLLDSLRFNQCNEMKYFSNGILSTPILKRIEVNGRLFTLTEDLNATIIREANQNGPLFTFANLRIVTENFKTDYLVGEGHFGGLKNRIRKGWIDKKTFQPSIPGTGKAVAIRKLNPRSEQELRECQSEIYFEKLWHPNVVKLLGHCWEDTILLLVYEHAQMGSLEDHLFTREAFSWDIRLRIAIGVARGLDFLHTSEPKVIHNNIKPSNILLDSNYTAKISDFRKANVGPSNRDSYVTTVAMGTSGYAAPEHVNTSSHLHVKSDVYSFGVVLLELITGSRVLDRNRPSGQHNLVDWSKPLLSQKRKLKRIIDRRLEGKYSLEAMRLAAQLCLKCLESNPESRPSMKEAVGALEQVDAIGDCALRPILIM